MNKTIRKFLGYAFFAWLVLVLISAAVITDYCMIYDYNGFQSHVGWWAMFLFLVIPQNIICFIVVYSMIKDKEEFGEVFTKD